VRRGDQVGRAFAAFRRRVEPAQRVEVGDAERDLVDRVEVRLGRPARVTSTIWWCSSGSRLMKISCVGAELAAVGDHQAEDARVEVLHPPGRFDDTQVAELPFLVTDATSGSLAMTKLHQQGMLRGFDDIKLLLIGTVPANHIHSREPVKSLADLKGKKIRAGSSQIAKLVEALGAVPVQIGAPQVAESLARGVIDASLNEWNFVATFKIDEVVRHHVAVPMGTVAVMVPMMKAKYDSLPPQARAAIDKHSGEALARRFGAVVDKTNETTRDRVAKSGKNTVLVPPQAERDAWRVAVQPVTDAWRKAAPQNEKIYQAFTEALKQSR
jgi:TRAP-type C4-dicarboxylate transport system substrate-binding protein